MSKIAGLLVAVAASALAANFDYSTATGQELVAQYQQLRAVTLDANQSFQLENATLDAASGSFQFKNGTLYLLQPIGGRVAGAVFVGEGSFTLKLPDDFERRQFGRFTNGQPGLEEPFKEVVLISTDDAITKLVAGRSARPAAAPSGAVNLLDDFRKLFRETLRSNVDARILAGLCSPRERIFMADIRGQKRGRFLFAIDPQSEDEVQLFRVTGRGPDLWTSFHLPEDPGVTARALVDTLSAKVDTALDKKGKLSASAEIEFTSLAAGSRVLYVHLARTLRVSKASTTDGAELKFIQEDKKKDADLWVILPKPLSKGEKCTWKIEYAGDEVVEGAGEGNFYVRSRTNWFPKLDIPGDPFTDRAIYKLRFQSPKDSTLVATGKLVKRSTEGNLAISEWSSETPYPVIGFNYGKFKAKSATDGGTEITVYANAGLNSELRQMEMAAEDTRTAARLGITGGINTTGMADSALVEATNSLRIFTRFFGPLPFSSLSITQQPASSYGQSWPTLVFMPYIAFLDSTVRNQWGITSDKSIKQFLEEVGPHEIAHQWWGHLIGNKTYHDEWLSEGFADYSAGLYLQATGGDAKLRSYLEAKKEEITGPLRESSMRACDAGPIWLGRRLSTDKNPDAYARLVYSKGAYVLHMLRMMLYDLSARNDSRFIAMMHDFVETWRGRGPSTEDFKAIVDKHFGEDMSWFFNQWVYGSELPKLLVQYSVTPNEKGALLRGTVAQSGVSKGFRTILPVMISFGKGTASGKITINGESAQFHLQLPRVPDKVEFNALYGALCDLEVKKI